MFAPKDDVLPSDNQSARRVQDAPGESNHRPRAARGPQTSDPIGHVVKADCHTQVEIDHITGMNFSYSTWHVVFRSR